MAKYWFTKVCRSKDVVLTCETAFLAYPKDSACERYVITWCVIKVILCLLFRKFLCKKPNLSLSWRLAWFLLRCNGRVCVSLMQRLKYFKWYAFEKISYVHMEYTSMECSCCMSSSPTVQLSICDWTQWVYLKKINNVNCKYAERYGRDN